MMNSLIFWQVLVSDLLIHPFKKARLNFKRASYILLQIIISWRI